MDLIMELNDRYDCDGPHHIRHSDVTKAAAAHGKGHVWNLSKKQVDTLVHVIYA